MRILVLIAFLAICSCKNAQSTREGGAMTTTDFEEILSGHQSNIDEPLEEIITSQDRLAEVFVAINSTISPKIDVPAVDFENEIVVFVNMGYKSSGGYAVAINAVETTSDTCVISVKETAPGPTDNVTMAITYPFTLVKLPRQDVPISFQK